MKLPFQFGFILVLTISSCLTDGNNDFNCAETFWEASDYKSAIIYYNKAIKSGGLNDDELAASHYNIATYFFLCFKADDSIKSANEALKLQPNHAGALSLRALAEDFLGYDEQALADWAKLLYLDPRDFNVYYDRSFFYSNRGQFDKAIEDMEMYLKLRPDDSVELQTLEELKAKLVLQQQIEKKTQ